MTVPAAFARTASSGALLLVALASLSGAAAWLFTGTLAAFLTGDEHEVVIVFRHPALLPAWIAAALAALLFVHALVSRHAPDGAPWRERLAWKDVSYLTPLALLGLPLVAVGLLATPFDRYATPWLFLFVDMRWWLAAASVALIVISLDAVFDRAWSRRLSAAAARLAAHPRAGLWREATLTAVLLASALLASPTLRFQSTVLGDEPKYLRFLENWYQGRGFDVSTLQPIAERPIDDPPNLIGNLTHLWPALSAIARDVAAEVGHAFGQAPRPPRSPGGLDWFADGKRGGLYQVHNPGFSALLFPGYVIDRYFLNWTNVYHEQFPTDLLATSSTVLLLYLLWGVALFRLLHEYSGRAGLSWLLALVAMLSMPASAFHHQYYPEVAAGLFVTVAFHHAVVAPALPAGRAFVIGLLTGALPWFHPRFGMALIVLAGAVAWTRRGSPRAGMWCLAGLLLPLGALGLYNYHITGNMMPWALYEVLDGNSGISLSRMWWDLPSFWHDWRGGVVAHAPIFVLGLTGLVHCWHRRPVVAVSGILLVVLTAALAAAHTWHGSGTTPLRMVAAVVPLLAIPLLDAVLEYRRSRAFVVAFAALAVVSVQIGFTYNRHMVKHESAALTGPSVSGWKPTMLLLDRADAPAIVRHGVSILAVVLIALPAVLRRRPLTTPDAPRWSWTAVTAAGLAGAAVIGSVHMAWSGHSVYYRYLPGNEASRDRVLRTWLSSPSGMVVSSHRGRIDVPAAFPNPESPELRLSPEAIVLHDGDPVEIAIDARGADRQSAWGTLSVDFGDGTPPLRQPIVGTSRVRHRFDGPGAHALTVALEMPGGGVVRETRDVHIVARNDAGEHPSQSEEFRVPPFVNERRATFAVEAIVISDGRVELRGPLPRRLRGATEFSIWMAFAPEQGEPPPKIFPAERLETGNETLLALRFAPEPPPPADERVGIIVMASADGAPARSTIFPVRWPQERLVLGSPVVMTRAEADR